MAMAPSPVPCHTPCTGGEENCVPDAHIYEEVIRQANIHPDETLFIDDLKENCEAAEKLGIHTFQNVKFDDWLHFDSDFLLSDRNPYLVTHIIKREK